MAPANPMERAPRAEVPSGKASGPKGHIITNEEGPEGPSGKVSGPKDPCEPNGECPEGPLRTERKSYSPKLHQGKLPK